MLVLAARDGQQTRIRKMILSWRPGDEIPEKLDVLGWWDLGQENFIDDFGGFRYNKLQEYDAVVILTPERVHDMFQNVMKTVRNFLKVSV